jgi:hypothetical protein
MRKSLGFGLVVVLAVLPPAKNARAQTAPAAEPALPSVALPTAEGFKLTEPMSRRMLFFRFDGAWKVERGGAVVVDNSLATGLDSLVAPSPRALEFALNAHRDLVTGAALTWTGLGVTLTSVIVGLVLTGTNPSSPNGGVSTGAPVDLCRNAGGGGRARNPRGLPKHRGPAQRARRDQRLQRRSGRRTPRAGALIAPSASTMSWNKPRTNGKRGSRMDHSDQIIRGVGDDDVSKAVQHQTHGQTELGGAVRATAAIV